MILCRGEGDVEESCEEEFVGIISRKQHVNKVMVTEKVGNGLGVTAF